MDKHSSYSDVDLINLAQQGNKEAYSLLILRYSNKIQQIIYFHVQDHTLVADLTQEVLLKIYKYLYFFKEKSQFSTWIYRITQNTIKNHYRNSICVLIWRQSIMIIFIPPPTFLLNT